MPVSIRYCLLCLTAIFDCFFKKIRKNQSGENIDKAKVERQLYNQRISMICGYMNKCQFHFKNITNEVQ